MQSCWSEFLFVFGVVAFFGVFSFTTNPHVSTAVVVIEHLD